MNLTHLFLATALPVFTPAPGYCETIESLYGRPLSFPASLDLSVPRLQAVLPSGTGDRFSAKVIEVIDGDSLQVEWEARLYEIRLADVDTPEYDQPFGSEAKRFSRGLAAGRRVTIEVRAVDSYNRRVSRITLPNGDSLHRELVRAGLAWWYRYYSDDESLGELERQAREAGRGLWADPDPVPPWIHRRNRRQRGEKTTDPIEL